MSKSADEPVLEFASAADFSAWLAANHARVPAIALRIDKQGGESSLRYAEALEVALAWGWIDSQKRALDASAWLQRFTPRGAKSPWSKLNRDKAEALIKAGRMHAPGLREVERAKRDGRWKRAYDGARGAKVPKDLAAALAANPRARAFFETLDAANRYAILYRVQTAKKAETRAQRIERFVAMCAQQQTLHPPRARKSTVAAGAAGSKPKRR